MNSSSHAQALSIHNRTALTNSCLGLLHFSLLSEVLLRHGTVWHGPGKRYNIGIKDAMRLMHRYMAATDVLRGSTNSELEPVPPKSESRAFPRVSTTFPGA
jgi:hypothetical protein